MLSNFSQEEDQQNNTDGPASSVDGGGGGSGNGEERIELKTGVDIKYSIKQLQVSTVVSRTSEPISDYTNIIMIFAIN